MTKTKKDVLWGCVIVLACVLAYCIVGRVQQYNYIHSEYRTGAMSVQKDPSEPFEVHELISKKQKNDGVTLYRAAYYPEAETLMLWFGGAEPARDIYIDDQQAKNYMSVSAKHGVGLVVFEDVPSDAIPETVTVAKTDIQYEAEKLVTFSLEVGKTA